MSETLEEVKQVLSAAEWAYLNYSETNTERKDGLARVERVRLWVERFRWIPCVERMPEGGVDVLISVQGVAHIACLSQLSGNWIDAEGGWTKRDVTHWMPLPEGPE